MPTTGTTTSQISAALGFQGLEICIGATGSPETFTIVSNVEDYTQAMKNTVVMVTNAGDNFVRRFPTVTDPGEPTFKIFWIPLEPSHRNSPESGGNIAAGLRYLCINKVLTDVQTRYPADANGDVATDAFKAYITSFQVTGKVAGVFEATVAFGISDQNPSFV